MEIVYTYKPLSKKIYTRDTDQKSWMIRSLKSIEGFNYTSHLVTTDAGFAKDLKVDKVTVVHDSFPEVWDSLKILVLDMYKIGDYFLSDNDVIYNKELDFNLNYDFYFDGLETKNWEWVYKKQLDDIKKIPMPASLKHIWDYQYKGVCNVGILKFNSRNFLNEYIDTWKDVYNELKPYFNSLSSSFTTPVVSQLVLTYLWKNKNYSNHYFTKEDWNKSNPFYTHYPGYLKFKNSSLI